jgi:hypothetical protein
MKPLITIVLLIGVLDRIEGDWAIIEWASTGETRDLTTKFLPSTIQEGDRILLQLRPHPAGDVTVAGRVSQQHLISPSGQVFLPSDVYLTPGVPLCATIRRINWTIPNFGRVDPATGTHEHGNLDNRLPRDRRALSAPVADCIKSGRSSPGRREVDRP